MNHKKFTVFIVLFLSGFHVLYAGNPVTVKQFINHKDWNFVENKGQLASSHVKYYGHQGGVYLYCKPRAISFVFTKEENVPKQISEATNQPSGFPPLKKSLSRELGRAGGFFRGELPKNLAATSTITTSRTDLVLVHSNPNAQIIASDQQQYYENYYTGGDANHGLTNVHTYKTITYKNIYPHIDMVLHASPNGSSGRANPASAKATAGDGGMEYEFVVYPGGKVSDIQIQWNGLQAMKMTKEGGMSYASLLGSMKEGRPVSFQGDDKIESKFFKSHSLVGFKVGKYDKAKVLVIDPSLIWGTYFGGSGNEAGNGVASDSVGNVYITGYTTSYSGIATKGAFHSGFGYNSVAPFLAKFNKNGKIMWATYFGGSAGYDVARSVALDNSGNVYITGWTQSDTGIATSGAYQTSLAGSFGGGNAFLAKFNSNGKIKWATYFGSSDVTNAIAGLTEGLNVVVDYTGNVYITGVTTSPDGIATQGAYLTTLPDSTNLDNNGFLAKFDSSGGIKWATYYFGTCYGAVSDKYGNVYITGYTEEVPAGLATKGAYQTSYGGSYYDAFLAKFNGYGTLQWATYYGGNGADIGLGIAADLSGNLYLTGLTSSTTGIATSGAFRTSFINSFYGNNAFLAKFNSSGDCQWATYYCGIVGNWGNRVATDNSGNVYIVGTTNDSSGVATNAGYQTKYGGDNDAFLAEFNDAGVRQWATYYGGYNSDEGIGVSADGIGNVYIAGWTQSDSGADIATSGAYQTSNGGDGDAFLAKFNNRVYDAGIDSILIPSKGMCPGMYSVAAKLKNYDYDTLTSVKIGWMVNDTLQTVYNWTGTLASDSSETVIIGSFDFKPGNTSLKVWTSKPEGQIDNLPTNDTSTEILKVYPSAYAFAGHPQTICYGDTVSLGDYNNFVSGDTYRWTSDPQGFDSSSIYASALRIIPKQSREYILTVTSLITGCMSKDSVNITVNPLPAPGTAPSKAVCLGTVTEIGKPNVKDYSYVWTSTPKGFSSTAANPNVNPHSTTLYILKETISATGCQSFDSVTITVNPLPVPNIDSAHYTICTGTHIRIGGNEVPNLIYSWASQPKGFTSSMSGPIVNPMGNTTYFLKSTDTITGCTNSDTAKVTVTVPKAPVANPGLSQTICHGNLAAIGADPTSGLSFSWASDPSGFTSSSAKAVVKPDSTTTYFLTVKNAIGCTDLGAVTVKVNPLPAVNHGTPQNICTGTVIQLGASSVAGDVYNWRSNPLGFSSSLSNPVDSPKITREYQLKQIITATGCMDSDSVLISVAPRPDVIFDINNINGFQYQFIANNPNWPQGLYHWNFGDPEYSEAQPDTASGYIVSHAYSTNGKYIVTLTVSVPGFCTEATSYEAVINEAFSVNIYPNPFYTQTHINYTLVKPAHIKISITDEIGRQLGTLLDKQLAPGEYNTNFDAALLKTRPAMYFVLFQMDDKLIVKKMIQLGSVYQ